MRFRRKNKVKKAYAFKPTTRRYKVRIVVDECDGGKLLAQHWMPPILDTYLTGNGNGHAVVEIRVSATSSTNAVRYVRRQLDRSRIGPVYVEAR